MDRADVFPSMVDKLPEGLAGAVRVEHFVVTPREVLITQMRHAEQDPPYDGRLSTGRFARLWVGKDMMMADTLPERRSCLEVVEKARGHVLIAGLGLGMILWPIAAKPEVESITVVERYRNVVRLVQPHIPRRVRVLNVDVFRYRPRQRFDTIFLDIWPQIRASNLIDMIRLERRYARHLAKGGWMASWARDACEEMARRELDAELWSKLMGKCLRIRRVPRKVARMLKVHP